MQIEHEVSRRADIELKRPTVSVVLPAFNCAEFLKEAVQSIREQTFTDWEMLIVFDASKDATVEIAQSLTQVDPRIQIIPNRFKGIAGALNTGVFAAKGRYIARMDGDDLSVPERFQRQVQFLENNQDVGVLGTRFEVFNQDGPRFIMRHPSNPLFNCMHLCVDSILGHPTVMMRKKAVLMAGGYFEGEAAEDLGLFARISQKWTVTNLEFVGLRYREHGLNLSVANRANVEKSALAIGRNHYIQITGYEEWHDLLVKLIQNPRSLGFARRLQAAIAATWVCLRAAERYGESRFSPLMRDAAVKIWHLLRGRNFHGE